MHLNILIWKLCLFEFLSNLCTNISPFYQTIECISPALLLHMFTSFNLEFNFSRFTFNKHSKQAIICLAEPQGFPSFLQACLIFLFEKPKGLSVLYIYVDSGLSTEPGIPNYDQEWSIVYMWSSKL